MASQVKIPSVGESVTEVTIAGWSKQDGDYVEVDEVICELESDKATVELTSEVSGTLKILAQEGDTIEIGAIIAEIDEAGASKGAPPPQPAANAAESKPTPPPQGATAANDSGNGSSHAGIPSPAANKILNEKNVNPESVQGTGKDGRITKADAMSVQASPGGMVGASAPPSVSPPSVPSPSIAPAGASLGGVRDTHKENMSAMRKAIAKRLVAAKNTTAMLTTFNEVDMKAVMDLRKKYKDMFKEKHQVGLGFMSFFTKACCQALAAVPAVNSQIVEENKLLHHDYMDVGIAVSTPKGLVVPVIRNAEQMSLAAIESKIIELALKARDGKIGLDEMSGGTFTITNGGIFGSMLSTPILNMPQAAILGMHNIVERPVVVKGEVVVRPIMYLALSYDHRVIDGRESVTFLKTIKELIEDPARLLLNV